VKKAAALKAAALHLNPFRCARLREKGNLEPLFVRSGYALGVIFLFLTAAVAKAQSKDIPAEGFLARSYHSSAGETIQYRLFVTPGYDAAKKYPVVLWLHDAGGRGSDNLKQISGSNFPGSHIWTTPENQAKYHAFVLAPQVDITKGWARPHANTPPVSIRLALEILDAVEKEYSIDPEEVYVTGQSMGGEGVWAALSNSPGRFAAAIALCGYGDASMIPHVAKVPVWIFQGQVDPVVPAEKAREWVGSLKQVGGNPKYTEYPGIGHAAWDVAFSEPALVAWLFAQRLKTN
jgi:predicted peptidase